MTVLPFPAPGLRVHASACAATITLLVTAPGFAGLIPQAVDGGIVIRGTVVTMDHDRSILRQGGVFVRGDRIMATWQGAHRPAEASSAVELNLGPKTLIFPGLINLHDHPTFNMLNSWPAPSSHRQSHFGRPFGTEPYANRYQWNLMLGQAPLEFRRMIDTPQIVLTSPAGLGLGAMAAKYAEVRAVLGGQTAIQGESHPIAAQTLIRNVETENFNGPSRVANRVLPIDSLSEAARIALISRMTRGELDAWTVHLAEGVRDADRPPGDPISSRAEFTSLRAKGLLTETTVIIHGTALEAEDFAAMRAAPSLHGQGSGDGRGARLVWSPLSNLLLYGRTTRVYQALAADVLVSLGTDWGPSGSRNLLDELKVADVALRDSRVLGADRDLVPHLSIAGKTDEDREAAEAALDRTLVEMVTVNPAQALRWTPFVGSIEPGKRADLLVITPHPHPSAEDLPNNPYRALIDATERDVRLVLVDGDPLTGDVAVMQALKDGDYEVITSAGGCFEKAVDVTDPSVPQGTQTFAFFENELRQALAALAGDHPPAGGGPAPLSNTYSYLKSRIPGAGALTDAQFMFILVDRFKLTADGLLNMEGIQLSPVLLTDDDFSLHLLDADVVPGTGLIADDTPPFKLYRSNFNHIGTLGNPLEAPSFIERYYDFCTGAGSVDEAAATRAGPSRKENHRPLTAWPLPYRGGLLNVSLAPGVAKHATGGIPDVGVYDLGGRRVRVLHGRSAAPPLQWDGRNEEGTPVRNGIYFLRALATREEAHLKIAVVR